MTIQLAASRAATFRLRPAVWTMSIGLGALIGTIAAGISLPEAGRALNALPQAAAAIAGHIGEERARLVALDKWGLRPSEAVPSTGPADWAAAAGRGGGSGSDLIDTANVRDASISANDPDAQAVFALLSTVGGGGIDSTSAPPSGSAWARLASGRDENGEFDAGPQALADGTNTLASWNYSGGSRSGHLALTGTNIGLDSAAVGFNAAASMAHGPMQFSGTLTGDDTGSWNGLASSQAAIGKVKFTASGNYASTVGATGDSDQIGYGLSATAALTDQVTLNGGLNWTHDEASTSDTRSYEGAVQLSHQLADDLKLTGELGVSASAAETWAAPPDPYGTTGVQWTPGGGSAISASFTDHADGEYSLATALNRQF